MELTKQAFGAVKLYLGGAPSAPQYAICKYVPGLAGPVYDWVAAHPYLAAFQATLGIPMFAGMVVAAPILSWLGFSTIGPVAGSTAAGYQAAHGATWVFSGLQSAQMGGYGVVAVKGVMAGASGVAMGVVEWFKGK